MSFGVCKIFIQCVKISKNQETRNVCLQLIEFENEFSLSYFSVTAMCASVFTLVAIAGDRFFAIVFPLKSRVTQRKVSVIIIVIWLAAIAIGLPVLFFYAYTERQWKNFVEKYCTEVWPQVLQSDGTCDQGKRSRKAYWICLLVVLNWVPMVLMMVAYFVIFIKLRKSRRVSKTGRLTISAVQQRSKKKVKWNEWGIKKSMHEEMSSMFYPPPPKKNRTFQSILKSVEFNLMDKQAPVTCRRNLITVLFCLS